MKDLVLLGNNFAVLVAASELAKRGSAVTVLTDGKPLGGHFAGIKIKDYHFDIGMVMLEKYQSKSVATDLNTYDPLVRNDWSRFSGLVNEWLDSQLELQRVQTPSCLIEGGIQPDFLISNRLDMFAQVGVSSPAPLSPIDPRHASHKNFDSVYDHLSYGEAARLNHGAEFHERFIEPFICKLTGVSSDQFLARYHRSVWAPLFYPETITQALAGNSLALDEYPFWTTPSGVVGEFIQVVSQQLVKNDKIKLITDPVSSLEQRGNQSWLISTDCGVTVSTDRLALGLSLDRLSVLLGRDKLPPDPGATICVLFAIIKQDAINVRHGCLMIIDASYAAYRLNDQDAMAGLNKSHHRVTIEARAECLAELHPGVSAKEALRRELIQLFGIADAETGAVEVLKCITVPNAIALPTPEQINKTNLESAEVREAIPEAFFLGGLLGYGLASLNDQLVQGLKIAKDFHES